ncbi:MAG: thioredoxin [Candidatus Thermoplasmatota archaeon]|nr:thioredoxin [Candidatus Thermoplasmatota archaeon]
MTDEELVTTVTDDDYEDILEDNECVVFDFWATWCSPCIQMDPIIEGLAEEYNDKVKFGKINIENNSEVPSRFSVQSLPSFLFFKDGEIVKKERGALSKEEFEEKLKKNFDL